MPFVKNVTVENRINLIRFFDRNKRTMEEIMHIPTIVRSLEETNRHCIYISLREKGNLPPVAYGRSARLLNEYFPSYPLSSVVTEEGETIDCMMGFPLEEVLEAFQEDIARVGDDYIEIVINL